MLIRQERQSPQNQAISAHQAIGAHWAAMAGTIRQGLASWYRRAGQRKALRNHLLWSDARRIEKDIGVAPGTLEKEAGKPFWRA